jgi:hypothetical protein
MRNPAYPYLILSALAVLCAFVPATQAAPVAFTIAGQNTADIQATVDAFRANLGALNNNGVCAGACTPGVGRREVNWDGVPDAFASGGVNPFPGNFFNLDGAQAAGRVRGIQFSSPGQIEVSANAGNPTGTPTLFGNHDADNTNQFAAFSAQRIFGVVGAVTLDVSFSVPGSPGAPALVRGFGAVFTDAEIAGLTSLEFFDADGNVLFDLDSAVFPIPVGAGDTTKSFAFAGVSFDSAVVARVRISAGDVDLKRTNFGNFQDLVAMDDFIFGEPVAAAVPEPTTLALACAALLAACGLRRRPRA